MILDQTKDYWKDIPGYEGKYQISNLGKVKSLYLGRQGRLRKKPKILKTYINNGGYRRLWLHNNKNRKIYTIHRLVCITFIKNSNNYGFVNHIDGNKLNNNVSNLEWVTKNYNTKHAYKLGLLIPYYTGKYGKLHPNTKKIKQMDLKGNKIKIWDGGGEILRKMNLSRTLISQACLGKCKTAGGYKWQYLN